MQDKSMIHPTDGLNPFEAKVFRHHRPVVPCVTHADREIVSEFSPKTLTRVMPRLDIF